MKVKNVLNRAADILENETLYTDTLSKMEKIKKAGKFKYPEYAEDEIEPAEKFVFVVNQMHKLVESSYRTPIINNAYYLLKKNKDIDFSRWTTEDKIKLRMYYCSIKYGAEIEGLVDTNTKESFEVKELCEKVKSGIKRGIINKNDFVAKIIATLEKNGYTRCSQKQKSIINDAIAKIELASIKESEIKAFEDANSSNILNEFAEMNAEADNTDRSYEEASTEAAETAASKNFEFSISGMSDLLGNGGMTNA